MMRLVIGAIRGGYGEGSDGMALGRLIAGYPSAPLETDQ